MKIEQVCWNPSDGWGEGIGSLKDADLVFVFGGTSVFEEKNPLLELRNYYPEAQIAGCTTSGEICDTEIADDTLVATAVKFDGTDIKATKVNVSDYDNCVQAGKALADALPKDNLKHVFVLSDGLNVNGTELVRGISEGLPEGVMVTGGLAGDGTRFGKTFVVLNDSIESGSVVGIGFYGDRIKVGYGSMGGWDPFGPERLVTKSEGNVLYEVDGQSVLGLYKKYLGEHAKNLPASGLLFPLSLRYEDGDYNLVRTILAVDEDTQSMTFAGDIPEGTYVRFMKANFDRLIDGAEKAAEMCMDVLEGSKPELAVLISCVGRRLVLKQRTEEEIEAVKEILGDDVFVTGFYSYGELAPYKKGKRCELHNQTMTITVFSEE